MLGMSEGREDINKKVGTPLIVGSYNRCPLLIKWEEGSGVRSPVDSIGGKEMLSSHCDSCEKYDRQSLLEG